MAHGFLRRLFEVFERFKTAVDVVTTSEVSVSVTVDDTRRLDGDSRQPAEFCRGELRARHGHHLRGRREADGGRHVVRPRGDRAGWVPLRLVSQAASRRNITFVLRDADVPHAMMRLHETFF